MTTLPEAMRRELAGLEAELASDPRFQKATRLRELLVLYGEPVGPLASASPSPARAARPHTSDPGRTAALEAVRQMLKTSGEPVRTSFLYDLLPDDVRSKIGGKEPASNLSAMLSKSPWFKSHGRRGWTLADEGDEPDATPATADDFDDLLGREEEEGI